MSDGIEIRLPNDRMREIKEAIRDILRVQCADGNWNYDSYMHGMANGMIMIGQMLGIPDLEFLEAPLEWLKDKGVSEKVECAKGEDIE